MGNCCRRNPQAKVVPALPPSLRGKTLLLSADVGGTNTRLHLFLPPNPPSGKDGNDGKKGLLRRSTDNELAIPKQSVVFEAKYANERFESFAEVMRQFLQDSGASRPPLLGCLAVAGSVVDNSAEMVNLGWKINGKELEELFGIKRVVLINDFEAQGYGVLTLDPKTECDVLQDTPPVPDAPKAVIGPGTGLGEAFLTVTATSGEYDVWPSEGGHAEFAPRQDGSSKVQFDMLQYLQIKFSARSRISVERIVSGRGISNIYEFLAWKYPEKINRDVHRRWLGPRGGPRVLNTAVIAEAATNGECSLCQQAMDIFVGAFGAEAGALALTYMPFGGVYLTGGVTAKNRDYIVGKEGCGGRPQHFMDAFLDKGRVSHMLKRVPVYLVRSEDTGERGAMLKAARLYQDFAWLGESPPKGHMGCNYEIDANKQTVVDVGWPVAPDPLLGPGKPETNSDMLLAADIGGTSSRLHLFRAPDEATWRQPAGFAIPDSCKVLSQQFKNSRYETFSDLLAEFFRAAQLPQPPLLACLAVAGVVVDNTVTFVNLGWMLDGFELEQRFRINRVVLINDFEAQGYGVLTLRPEQDCDVMQDVDPLECAPKAVVGAGTGLGECFLTMGENNDYDVWPAEGGHAEFAPRQDGSSNLQFEMLQYLQIKFSSRSRISVERVISGRGLSNIYEFLAWRFPNKVTPSVHRAWMGPLDGPRLFDPAVISKAASSGECKLCEQAVAIFVGAYGAEAGVLALKYMPFGGLYLTGGVTAKLSDFILNKDGRHSPFMDSFLDKGRVSSMLERVPVYRIRGEDMGERGALLKACRLYSSYKQGALDSKGHMCNQRSSSLSAGFLQPPDPTAGLIQVRPRTPVDDATSPDQPKLNPLPDRPLLLSADVGGTSSRLHLFMAPKDLQGKQDAQLRVPPGDMIYEQKFKNSKYESFSDVLSAFLVDVIAAGVRPYLACLAVAGAVVDNQVRFVNLGWVIDGTQLQQEFGIEKVVLINDFEAQGYGVLTLDHEQDCEVMQRATPLPCAPKAILGAGTGLGEAFLTVGANGDYEVWPSEGGHAEFAARQDGASKVQFDMLQYLQIKYSAKARISVERIVSGRGLSNIYEFLCWQFPEKVKKAVHQRWLGPPDKPTQMDPSVITEAARSGESELCQLAVDTFIGAYGAEAGVQALTYMPFGGLYLTGGVTSKMLDMIKRCGVEKDTAVGDGTQLGIFMKAFLDKGRVSHLLTRIPVYVVRGEDTGERGAMLKACRLFQEIRHWRPPSAGHMTRPSGVLDDKLLVPAAGAPRSLQIVDLAPGAVPADAVLLMAVDIGNVTTRLQVFAAPSNACALKEDVELYEAGSSTVHQATMKNAAYESFAALLTAFLKEAALRTSPAIACVSIAGVDILDGCAVLPNLGWTIESRSLQTSFNMERVVLISDCEAQGYGILTLSGGLTAIQAVQPLPAAPKVVIGVGASLRECFLTVGGNNDYEVWPTEAGHAEFASRQDGSSKLQFEMLQFLQIKFSARSRLSLDRVVSGRGVSNIYEFLAWKFPEKVKDSIHRRWLGAPQAGGPVFDPEVVVQAALSGTCELCAQAIDVFIGTLASFCGVAGLKYMPYGGLYITGDLPVQLRAHLLGEKGTANHFMDAYMDKGRVSKMLTRVPVYLVSNKDLAERGARLKASRLYQEKLQGRVPAVGHMDAIK